MRTWGVTFVVVGASGAFLPEPLWWWLLAVVSAAGVLSLCSAYSDARTRREVVAALETDKHVAHIDAVKALPPAEWEEPFDERSRLRSVELKVDASIVAPPADDSWLEDLIRPNAWSAPLQRRPGAQS